jgi:chitinase
VPSFSFASHTSLPLDSMIKSLITFVLCCACLPMALAHSARATKPEIIAYVFKPKSVIEAGEIAAEKLTRVNYAFALIRDGEIVNGYPYDDQNLAALVALKGQNPSLKVLISVGGWLGSGNFSDMVLTKESRSRFIESAVRFIDRNHLDGLDIDWEYPGLPGAANRFRPEDKHNYTLLFKDLRKRFRQEERRTGRHLLITTATGAMTDFLEHTEMKKVQKYVDSVNLMAYDYYESSSDRTTGHHAPLFRNPTDPKKISADRSVQEFEKAGVPAKKIVLGVPFYGRSWGEVDDAGHGLFRPGKTIANAFARYGDIQATMSESGYVRYWDSTASSPYLYSAEKKIFVSYEDPESLALKCKYVRDHRLAGMMFWDYAADPSGALLNSLDMGLWGPSSPQ